MAKHNIHIKYKPKTDERVQELIIEGVDGETLFDYIREVMEYVPKENREKTLKSIMCRDEKTGEDFSLWDELTEESHAMILGWSK